MGKTSKYSSRRCEECGKRPCFGMEWQRPTHCFKCKTDEMTDVVHAKCTICKEKRPFYGKEWGKPTHCAKCNTDKLKDVVTKRCVQCEETMPCYGLVWKKPTHCEACATPEMTNVKDNKCEVCKKKQASCGLVWRKPTHCADCVTDGMTDVINKRCEHPLCQKHATFGLEINKKTHCFDHKTDKMFRACRTGFCKNCNLTRVDASNYDGLCATCFTFKFPDDPRKARTHNKELKVRQFIDENFKDFIHDKPLITGGCDCSVRRRIDHRCLIGNTLIAIETDEFQHRKYDEKDEEARYNDLMMGLSCKYIFIRFNPDKYKVNGNTKNPQIQHRLPSLKREIEKQIKRAQNEENTDLVEITYLYYSR